MTRPFSNEEEEGDTMSGFGGLATPGLTKSDVVNTITNGSEAPVSSGAVYEQFNKIVVNNEVTITAASVSSATWKTMATISGLTGRYIIIANMQYGTATEGIRVLMVDVTEGTQNTAANSVLATGRAVLQKVRGYTLNGSETIYIRAYQNSGSAVNCDGSYRIIQLR